MVLPSDSRSCVFTNINTIDIPKFASVTSIWSLTIHLFDSLSASKDCFSLLSLVQARTFTPKIVVTGLGFSVGEQAKLWRASKHHSISKYNNLTENFVNVFAFKSYQKGGVDVPCRYLSYARWSYRWRIGCLLCACSMCDVNCSRAIPLFVVSQKVPSFVCVFFGWEGREQSLCFSVGRGGSKACLFRLGRDR